jgi:arylsulfatase A-like enzyme
MTLFTALFASLFTAAHASEEPRNILLIIADDLGVDKVGVYVDNEYPTYGDAAEYMPRTPNIDRLARHGVRFERAWANPVCTSTRAGLYTGTEAAVHGVGHTSGTTLSTYAETIAEALPDRYQSGLFGKWHLGAGTNTVPTAQGYDEFAGTLGGTVGDSYSEWRWTRYIAGRDSPRESATLTGDSGYPTAVTTADALDFIGRQQGPWMATVAYHAPHDPWDYPPASLECFEDLGRELDPDCCASNDEACQNEANADRYRAMAECMDTYTRRLLDGIDDDVLENTLVIFMGDNGTPPKVMEAAFADSPGHKANAYRDGVHVPFIVADGFWLVNGTRANSSGHAYGVTVREPNRSTRDLMSTTDLYATLHDVVGRGMEVNDAAAESSFSFIDRLRTSDAEPARDEISSENFARDLCGADAAYGGMCGEVAVRDGRYAWHTEFSSGCSAEQWSSSSSMFDLQRDPFQLEPLDMTSVERARQDSWALSQALLFCEAN